MTTGTYGVTLDDVAGELKSLFPGGFGPTTSPDDAAVASWILAADVFVTLAVKRAAGANPQASDQAAPLARRYIVSATKAEVIRAAYAGRDPLQVKAASDPYDLQARDLLAAIKELGVQATADGTTPSRVRGDDQALARDLTVGDADLGGLTSTSSPRFRRF